MSSLSLSPPPMTPPVLIPADGEPPRMEPAGEREDIGFLCGVPLALEFQGSYSTGFTPPTCEPSTMLCFCCCGGLCDALCLISSFSCACWSTGEAYPSED